MSHDVDYEDYHDALYALVGDLISEPDGQPFLSALFQTDAGAWTRATHLCRDAAALRRRIQTLERRAIDEGHAQEARLSVRWQPYGDGFGLVTFFLDVNMWSCMHVVKPGQSR